ncbi:MAG TPA: LptF/LptG family permease [Kiritimatiellia bacterium]|nr:LptF/LptG family permease [Kiritimatiellia bacterium]
MRVLGRYLSADYLVIFTMTVLIFTFVMCIGVLVRAIDYAAMGVSAGFIGRLFLYNIPYMLSFTIPMGVLTAVLLLFGRLSLDGELTAMKACGLTIWQIVAPVVILSVVATLACLYINAHLAPVSKHLARELIRNVGAEEPVHLLEPGRFVRDFPGLLVFVSERKGNELTDVVVYEMDDAGPVRHVRAARGTIRVLAEERAMEVDLFDVRIDQREKSDAGAAGRSHYINAEHYPVRLDFSRMSRRPASKKASDMTLAELQSNIRNIQAKFPELMEEDLLERERMKMVVEVNKRLALSLSCFAFALLGIPLGMQSRRKESSAGIGIALMLVFLFYLFIVTANALVGYPGLRPDLIVWVPVFGAEIGGFLLLRRVN